MRCDEFAEGKTTNQLQSDILQETLYAWRRGGRLYDYVDYMIM